MEYTPNANLKKPGYSDTVDIKDINDNFDAVDEHIGADIGDMTGAHGMRYNETDSVFEVLDAETNQWTAIKCGKSPYEYAVAGGYTGTEDEFMAMLTDGPLSGGDMTGNIDMNNHYLTGLPAPVAPSDAVNYQTLIDAIAGASAFALIKISGKTRYQQDTYYRTAAVIEKIDTYGTDTVLRINKTVDRPVDMYYATSVAVELPAQFKFPSSNWSDIGSYTPLTAAGNRMGANNESGKVVLKYVGNIDSSSFSIDGYVKAGVNA